MNIEFRFLQKAIEDKNYIGFEYNNKRHNKIKPINLKEEKEHLLLVTTSGEFEFDKIRKLTVLKERF
jgi:predicted DNA-binding transcriptional regulator YafY